VLRGDAGVDFDLYDSSSPLRPVGAYRGRSS